MHVVWLFQLDNHFTKKGGVNLRAGDLSNLVQGIEDALQKAEIIKDDALIVSSWMQKTHGPNQISVMVCKAW